MDTPSDSVDETAQTLDDQSFSFSKADLYGIQDLLRRPKDLFRLLVNSVCPETVGHELVKAGMVLTLLSGQAANPPGTNEPSMGTLNMLLVGDPGQGSRRMLSAAHAAAPRAVMFECPGRIDASVTRLSNADEYSLEAGPLVLSDRGLCVMDNLTALSNAGQQRLLAAMRSQRVRVSHAASRSYVDLYARAVVLATATPYGGRCDRSKISVVDNLELPESLISQFDLVFVLDDTSVRVSDSSQVDNCISLHSSLNAQCSQYAKMFASSDTIPLSEYLKIGPEHPVQPLPSNLLRAFLAYAQQYVHPQLTRPAATFLRSWYTKLQSEFSRRTDTRITVLHLESASTAALARARAALRTDVTEKDARDATEIVEAAIRTQIQVKASVEASQTIRQAVGGKDSREGDDRASGAKATVKRKVGKQKEVQM
ncbi:DNA replication licensing factor mcm8 [Thoreauomyces humboldtii]|nr:DNA replication licensing factor mcm8 [Thoreauomyces humboldtii]